MIWTVPNIWQDGRCFIIGGGQSMPRQFGVPEDLISKVNCGELPSDSYSPYLSPIHNEHVIGVNNSYLLGHWLDICFFGDCVWYNVHRLALAQWPNLKVTCCPRFEDRSLEKMEGIRYLAKDKNKKLGLSDNPSKLSWNFNSGSSAMGLARHLGVRQMVLLGFDMRPGAGGATHWHRGHGHKKTSYDRFLKGFPIIANDARRLGIEIINASPGSAIQDFPKVELKEVL